MMPSIGAVCAFQFIPSFAALNGVYRVSQVLTFESAVEQNVNFLDLLYFPVGKTESDYAQDAPLYASTQVMRLELVSSLDTDVVIVRYVPYPLIATIPDPNVFQVTELVISCNLGYQKDPDSLAWLVLEMEKLAKEASGDEGSAILMTSDVQWMSDAQYQVIADERQANITQIKPIRVAYRELEEENIRLRARIAALEEVVKQNIAPTP